MPVPELFFSHLNDMRRYRGFLAGQCLRNAIEEEQSYEVRPWRHFIMPLDGQKDFLALGMGKWQVRASTPHAQYRINTTTTYENCIVQPVGFIGWPQRDATPSGPAAIQGKLALNRANMRAPRPI